MTTTSMSPTCSQATVRVEARTAVRVTNLASLEFDLNTWTWLNVLPTDYAKTEVDKIMAAGEFVGLPVHAFDGDKDKPMHPNKFYAKAAGSLVEVTFTLTCSLFKRGSIYDTNFFADINDITILAHSGYTKQLTQERVVPDDNNGEGPSGTTNLSLPSVVVMMTTTERTTTGIPILPRSPASTKGCGIDVTSACDHLFLPLLFLCFSIFYFASWDVSSAQRSNVYIRVPLLLRYFIVHLVCLYFALLRTLPSD